jgi:ferredoxin-NADP reductase
VSNIYSTLWHLILDARVAVPFFAQKNTNAALQFANFLIAAAITDPGGSTRTFSIAGAPHEADLMIATRMRDTGFKRALRALPIGSEGDVQGPFGDFTLLQGIEQPAVLLAGGIGITPFRRMLRHAIQTHSKRRIFLFYSVRDLREAAFLGELQEARPIQFAF